MKAVLRLVYTYFTCTPAAKLFSVVGVVLIGVTWFALRTAPPTFVIGVVLMAGIASL